MGSFYVGFLEKLEDLYIYLCIYLKMYEKVKLKQENKLYFNKKTTNISLNKNVFM